MIACDLTGLWAVLFLAVFCGFVYGMTRLVVRDDL